MICAAVDASTSSGEADALDAGADVGSEFHHMHAPTLTPEATVDKGSAQREQNPTMTAVTALACEFRPAHVGHY